MALSFGKIGGELLKPGGAGRVPAMLSTELGGYIGRKIRGDNQTSNITPVKPVQSKQIQTYNSRYPGFDEEDYNRLLQIVDSTGKTGSEKAQLMDEAYQYYYPQVLNKHKLDERQETINNWVYENGEKLANGDKITNAQYRLLNLTQMAKEKFDIAYNVEDSQIIHNIVEKTPNGQELLTKFLDTGDPELLYETGIYDKGQQVQDFRSQKDIANEVLGGNFWKNAWNAMYANSFAPLDSWEKSLYKGVKNINMIGSKIDDYVSDKLPEGLRKDVFGDKTPEQIKAENQEFRDTSRREIDDYIGLVNNANQSNRARTVNPIVDNYYQRRNFTDLLAEGDIDGFFYKGLGDAASNRDMPVIIGASIINPAMGTALMGTNSYVRESEEAYEAMRNAGATHEQAEIGGGIVGLVNSAIEVYLDKLLGGVETSTTKGAREAIRRNVMNEVVNKPFEEIVSSATKTYVGSSLEEGLEEWLQNIVTNAAEMTVKENPEWKDLFEGGRAAAEGGIFNPMNIVSGVSNVAQNTDINSIKQGVSEGVNNIVEGTKNLGKSFSSNNNEGVIDRITDWGAEKITDTVSPQDKLYKAQEPLMQTLTKSKDLEKKRGNSDRANQLILENGFIPTDTSSRLEAHDTTMKNIWQQIEDKINGGKEIMIDLSEISDVLDKFIAKQKRTKSTLFDADLERLSKESAALRGQQISLPDVERLKQGYNAKINNWGDEKISDVMANGLREATHKIGVIEDNLLSEIPGEFQALKNDFGALKDTYEDVFKADMRNQRRKGGTLAETYSRIEGISDIVNGVLGTLTGKGDLQSIAKGGAKILVGKSLAKAKNVDFLIEQGFKELAKQYGNNGNITTDTVISENVNKMAGNQAQELYNEGDNNLSPNSEQMETTKKKSTKRGKKGDVKQYADEAYKPEIVMTEEEINKFEENDTKKTTKKDATEWAEKMWKKDGWVKSKDGNGRFRYADHWIKEGVKPGEGHWTKVYETATEKQYKERVKEHAKMKIAFDKADSKNNSRTKQYADNSYKPSITITEEEINKWEEKNGDIKQQGGDDIMRTQDIDKLIKIAIAVDETRGNKLKERLKGLDLVPKERVNNELFNAFGDTKTLLGIVIDNYNNGEWEMELPIRESGKRPRATRPQAGNDVEFNLIDELPQAHIAGDIEYITQDGDWLGTRGVDEENIIRIAYPDEFEQYDTNSFSNRQNWNMNLMADSGIMKFSYNDGYVNIDIMYEPTEEQLSSLRDIQQNEGVKRVQLNILDPQAKHTVRIADFGDMDETIDYINDYFGNGESSSTLDTATLKKPERDDMIID